MATSRSECKSIVFLSIYSAVLPLNSLYYVLLQQQDKHPNSDNVDLRNFRDFRVIKQRLLNWFVHKAKSSATFSGDEKKRFDSLRKKVDRSHAKFVAMGISKRESVSGNADIITGAIHFKRNNIE